MRKAYLIALALLAAGAALAAVVLVWRGREPGGPQAFPRLEGLPRFVAAEPPPRVHDGPVTEFIPGDYGAIFPFLGAVSRGQWGWTFDRYGFIDAQGRIVCDPIFNDVALISHGGRHAYVVSSNWAPPGAHMPAQQTEGFRAVVSADGSFFGRFEDVYTGDFFMEFDYELIPVKQGGKWGAIDFSGNQVIPFAHPNAPLFSHGLAAVFRWAEYEHLHEYLWRGVEFYYIDTQGNTVLGPFESPPLSAYAEVFALHLEAVMFHGGLAKNFYGGRYGFIDTAGRLVIERNYLLLRHSQFGWNSAGLALVALADTQEDIVNEWGHPEAAIVYALMDREGNYVALMPASHVMGVMERDGYYVVQDVNWSIAAVYSHAGEPQPVHGEQLEGNGYFRSWLRDDSLNFTGVRIAGNGIDRSFAGAETQVFWLFGDWFSVRDEEGMRMWNAQTGEERRGVASVWYRVPGRNVVVSSWDEDQLFGVLDDDGNTVIDIAFSRLRPIGENYFAAQGRYGGLLAPSGQWLIRTRLASNFD